MKYKDRGCLSNHSNHASMVSLSGLKYKYWIKCFSGCLNLCNGVIHEFLQLCLQLNLISLV